MLEKGRSLLLDRRYERAENYLESAVRRYPHDRQLRLELGRAYVAIGEVSRASGLFRHLMAEEPGNREPKLELAKALAFRRQFAESDRLYRALLDADPQDEAAAIGLASNLLHERQRDPALAVIKAALAFHPASLRLMEYQDRVERGAFGGEELALRRQENSFQMESEYINDSGGNHSWRASQLLEMDLSETLSTRLDFEQQFQHSRDDSFEAVQTFTDELRWRPREYLRLDLGGGAVRFNNRDVHAVYHVSTAVQALPRLTLGGSFSRVPVTPDAEASEHRLTAQGWEAFSVWSPGAWLVTIRASRQHYSDRNIGSRQGLEVQRQWRRGNWIFQSGYLYRRYSFSRELEHGYFSPDNYQSHLAMVGLQFHASRFYRGEVSVRAGEESPSSESSYSAAGDISVGGHCCRHSLITWIG